MKCYRKAFTLIEIFITIAILGLVSATFCYKGFETLNYYRINMSKQKLKEELNLAKHLSSSYQMDIQLTLYKEKKKWKLSRSGITETKAIPSKLNQYFLKEISLSPMNVASESPLIITYFCNGDIQSNAKLNIQTAANKLEEIALNIL